jgi:hypothetical protein
MAELIIALISIAAITALLFMAFIGGFAVGTDQRLDNASRLTKARICAVEAERQLHDLTRRAFVAMAEAAERKDRP